MDRGPRHREVAGVRRRRRRKKRKKKKIVAY
jgi:hypothetical protein